MVHPLPADIEELKSLTRGNPGVDGMLGAMLVLLENAPDSSLITSALSGIDPAHYQSNELRRKAAKLLNDAGAHQDAARWQPEPEHGNSGSNVVSISDPSRPIRVGSVRDHDNGIGFDAIGGLENIKAQVRRKIINPFLNKGLFNTFKRRAGGGVLMYGPPGLRQDHAGEGACK